MNCITHRYPLPTCAIHGEDSSVRVTARVVSEPEIGMPKIVIDMDGVKGIPLTEIHKLETFLTSVYDWRRLAFNKGEIK